MTNERLIDVDGVQLCTDAIGDPRHPAIVLISGAGGSMDSWEPEFCCRLADGGRYVIRYDQRDTGRSVSYAPGAPGYSIAEMVSDLIGILDAYGVGSAHVVGISLGGVVAQLFVLDHPDRVLTLTLIATSPGPGDADLPGRATRLTAVVDREPEWSDRDAVVDYIVGWQRLTAAESEPFDADGVRAVTMTAVARTTNVESSLTNHHAIDRGRPWRRRLRDITVPTLVIHGREDPVLPDGHGIALAAELPDARLLLLAGVGHELPARAWDTLVPAILSHTALR
jgi:pimeloyl-ACP methyl ester carboxylesterase